MRNLKRALSLALASVMLLGMMVVGTSAASYPDVDSKDNLEAIEVLKAVGVMTGDDKGNFNPDQKVTRNEMAVVMVNLLDLKVEDYKGTAPFTDVPAWAEPYVSACYANKIVSGASATTYNGAASVTAAEAALMLQKALGYFEFQVDFGDDWKLATIKNASKIELFDGVSVSANTALTRNQVAQLALNTLESVVVVGEQSGNTTSITAGDVSIEVTGKTTYEKQENKLYYNSDQTDKYEYLIEKLYDEDYTKNENGISKLGLPAVVWTDEDEDEEIVAIAKDADAVVVADDVKTLAALYEDKVDDDYDGAAIEGSAVAGDVVYFYEADNGDVTGYVVHYVLAQVTDIDDDVTKAQIKDDIHAVITIEVDGKEIEINDKDFADFDYEEDDYILVVLNAKKTEVLASEAVETVEGTITSVKSGKYNIGGTYYKNLSDKDLAVEDDVVVGLNKAGQIVVVIELNETAKSDDYAYIYNIVKNDSDKNADGVDNTNTYTVYVVLADGNKASYVVEEDSVAKLPVDKDGKFVTGVIPYSINKDKELEVEDTDNEIEAVEDAVLNKDSKAVTTKDGKVYANSATEFVFASWNDKGTKLTATTATGIKNVDISADVFVIYDKDDKDALYVFVQAKDEGVESDTMYAVLLDADYVYTKDDDGKYYTYTVFADGKETELTFETAALAELSEGDVFAYKFDGDYAVTETSELVEGTVTYVGEDFIEIDGKEYTADDATIYTVTKVFDDKGEYDYTEAAAKGTLKKDTEVLFKANKDDEITLAFILKEDK